MNATTLAPSSERRQHSRVVRDRLQIADTAGRIGVPWRAETLLEKLQRAGDITRLERAAGEHFHEMFRIACFDPLRSPSLDAPVSGRGHNPHLGADPARRTVAAALNALGGIDSLCGACAWHVLGNDCSMRDFAIRQAWRGKPMSPHQAKGALLGTLGVLTHHWA